LEREATFLRHADRVFVMGPSTQRVLVAEYGVPEGRVHVVGAGPNTDLGPARTRTAASRLLFVGTQWELKGGPELLAAFEMVRPDHPDLELTIVGCTPEQPLPAGVRALGRVPHGRMDEIFDAADILVMPTHMEAFGIALIEGLMKGMPCIGTTVGNQQWIIADAGLAVEPGDVPPLAAALRRVMDEFPMFHRSAVARGMELRATMSWSRVAEHIVAELELER
jgi:glycosyltransferase involved in cell wall biosynthesis